MHKHNSMRPLLACALLATAAHARLLPLYGAAIGAASVGDAPTPYILRLAPGTKDDTLCQDGSCQLQTSSVVEGSPFRTLRVPTAAALQRLRERLVDSALYIERDSVASIDVVKSRQTPERYATSTEAPPSWGLDRIDQPALPLDNQPFLPRTADGTPLDGTGVHLFVVDTGIALHDQFQGRLGEGYAVDGGCALFDSVGHGTHVAGVAGGRTFGIARNVTLHPVRAVLASDGSTTISYVVAALAWVKRYVQAHSLTAVVNLSISGGVSVALNDAVDQLSGAGVPVVASAGNQYGQDACQKSPASSATAITVGGTTETDARAPFSNTGVCVDLWAPGAGIRSAGILWGSSGEAVMSGTSQASPHVAGAAVLVRQLYPDASPQEVLAILQAAAVQLPGGMALLQARPQLFSRDPAAAAPVRDLPQFLTP